MTFFKTRCLGAAAVLLMAGGFAAAETIKVSTRASNWDIVLEESGVAEKYGIEIEFVPMKAGADVAEAIITNSVNVGSIGDVPLTALLARTDLVTVIGTAITTDGSYAKVIVPIDSPLKGIEDLKGKKIATKIGSGSYRAMADWCEKNGCSLNDFEFLNTSPTAITAAIESGSVDAGIWFAPTTLIAVEKGFGRILMDFDGANESTANWVVNNSFYEENPEAVVKFLAATIDAQHILVNDPARAAQLLEQGMKKRGRDLTADILEKGLADFDYTPRMDVEVATRIFSGVWESLKNAGKVRGDTPDFAASIDSGPHEQAEAMVKAASN